MNRLFRQYHRWMAIVFALPLLTTVISGIAVTLAEEWFHSRALARVFLGIHTWEIVGLGALFPVVNGLGLLGLLATGLYMTRLFRPQRYMPPS